MRKRVTFVEQLEKEKLLMNGSGHVLMRSAEANKRYVDGHECSPGQQLRKIYRGGIDESIGSQHMTTIHIPKSMMSAPFLQHPGLTAGQRRYLCSIANVYSTEHMRRQMKQRYLSVLHTCVQSGQNHPTCRRGHRRGENSTVAERDAEPRAKLQGRRKGSNNSSSGTAHSDVILPKIVNRRGM